MKYKKLCLFDACSEGNKQMNLSDEIDETGSKTMYGCVERKCQKFTELGPIQNEIISKNAFSLD
jgi:hypothetical protein